MNESNKIMSIFSKLYNKDPWLGVEIKNTLSDISTEQAANHLFPNSNSIAEIVNHLLQWRKTILKRLQGENIPYPKSNYFEKINTLTATTWQVILQELEDNQQQWLRFLSDFHESDFDKKTLNGNSTFYELVHGIMQHDAYHLGQIVLLAKFKQK